MARYNREPQAAVIADHDVSQWSSEYLRVAKHPSRCPNGHILEQKEISGFRSSKACRKCGCDFDLFNNPVRNSCKDCDFHLCQGCTGAVRNIWTWEKKDHGMACPSGHKLEAWPNRLGRANGKSCARCGESTENAHVLFGCLSCSYHLCDTCHTDVRRRTMCTRIIDKPEYKKVAENGGYSCRRGHKLEKKICSGLNVFWGIAPAKDCTMCSGELTSGMLRYSCKPCDFHVCSPCQQSVKTAVKSRGDDATKKGLAGSAKPSKFPEHSSLLEIFAFHDTSRSSYLSQQEFANLEREMLQLLHRSLPLSRLGARSETNLGGWQKAGGEEHGFVNFVRFCTWAQLIGVRLPVGLDVCRRPMLSVTYQGTGQDAKERRGLVPVSDTTFITQVELWLNASHKAIENWTRDRGCRIHGVNGCDITCACRNRVEVPNQYIVRKVLLNSNPALWKRYCLTKDKLLESCKSCSESPLQHLPVATGGFFAESDPSCDCDGLSAHCNEWRLMHGTSFDACQKICAANFDLSLVGKNRGALYGPGAYQAECVTKADEYAKPFTEMERRSLELDQQGDVFAMVVSRCLGGKAKVVSSQTFVREELAKEVFHGPYHSVLGDRVRFGKPFREMVFYDVDQVFPEFIVVYQRAQHVEC